MMRQGARMIYLDNSATTRTLEESADVAKKYMMESYFNPAAAYSPAVEVERAVNAARTHVAQALNVTQDEIVFTSGGTESNNMAFTGALQALRDKGRIIIGGTEHPSVFDMASALASDGYDMVIAPVDSNGMVDINRLKALIKPNTQFVSVMHVNNEVGAINDIASIGMLVRRMAPNSVFHVDGVQGFLKVPFDARHCDMYTISGHKFHAPKGVGALYVRAGLRFRGRQIGGGQENGRRSGTTNTPGIMGMNAAIEYYVANQAAFIENMRECKNRLAFNLATLPDVLLNSQVGKEGAPHILNASFLGVRGEVLLHALEEKGIYVSTGSACTAHKKGKNRILNAMNIMGDRQEGAIRFSFCPFNSIAEMDETSMVIADILPQLRKYKRR